MALSVRYCYDDHLELSDGSVIWADDFGHFGAPLEVVGAASLPRLRRALRAHAGVWGLRELTFWLSDEQAAWFTDETSPALPYGLALVGGELHLHAIVFDTAPLPSADGLADGVRPLLDRRGARLLACEAEDVERGYAMRLSVAWDLARRTVEDAARLGDELVNLVGVIARGGLDRSSAGHLADAGLWDLFVGIEETDWLEVKSQHYEKTERGRLNFATDVAAFCNAGGGMLIIGMKTKRHPDGDRIASINGCPLGAGTARRYGQLIRRLIHPEPVGVTARALRRDLREAHGILVVDIPDQPAHVRPFLVSGGVVGRSVHGALIGVPTRRGADTDWLSTHTLHASLRAGRAALGL
jgi:hypothetical protein